MCGIWAISRTTELTRLMTPTLAIAMEARGDDSWGVTDGEFTYRDAHAITESFIDFQLEAPLYHTRAASVGCVSERNAHPFTFKDKYIITGVHNGHLSNYTDLKTKYNRTNFEVDSEHIFAHLAAGLPVAELDGWGAVAWYEAPADQPEARERYFSRFKSDAFAFGKMKSGEIVFASTEAAIKTAAILAGGEVEFFYKTEPNIRYFIKLGDNGDDHLWHDKPLPWGDKPYRIPFVNAVGASGRIVHGNHGVWDCQVPQCQGKIKSMEHLICEACYNRLAHSTYVGAEA